MVIAIVVVILSGVNIVIARTLNAKLAQLRGIPYSTLMNYITGLTGSLIVFFLMGSRINAAFPAPGASFVIYIGGALGLLSVFVLNMITAKLPAMQLTLLVFVGQLFSGMLLDYFLTDMFSPGKLVGGILVLAGLLVNMLADKKE